MQFINKFMIGSKYNLTTLAEPVIPCIHKLLLRYLKQLKNIIIFKNSQLNNFTVKIVKSAWQIDM